MGDVAIGWLVWVALAGGVAGCSVYEGLAGVLQLWVAVWAMKLLCWEGVVGLPMVGSVLSGGSFWWWLVLVVYVSLGWCRVCWLVADWRGCWFGAGVV